MLCFLSIVISNSFRGFQSIAVKPTKFTSCHMAASNQNGAGGTCAGMGNGAWPEIDVEGSGIMVDPPSTGADTVVVGVAAPCGGKCLPPPWPHPQPQKGVMSHLVLGQNVPYHPLQRAYHAFYLQFYKEIAQSAE